MENPKEKREINHMNTHKLILLLSALFLFVQCSHAQMKFMSYNIRYDNKDDGDNWWELRKDEVVHLLQYYSPEFIGLQEAMPNQLTFIADHLDNYNFIGHGRDGSGTDSEATPIFYNKYEFNLIKSDIFWLSETPKKPSKGWDASLNRIVVYGSFENQGTGDTLHVFNCHFDHLGAQARENSSKQLIDYIKDKNLSHKKIILMGDLNSLPSATPIKILGQFLKDSYQNHHRVYGPVGTFNQFDTKRVLTQRIDYIFVRNVEVKSYRAIDDKRKNNLYPSDHLPIIITL